MKGKGRTKRLLRWIALMSTAAILATTTPVTLAAAEERGEYGMTPMDLVEKLPAALRHF